MYSYGLFCMNVGQAIVLKMGEKKFMIELIELYGSLPALWDMNSKEYIDKNLKNQQYEILLEKFKEKFPNAGKRELAQKLNSLRTQYRKELKRIESLKKNYSTEGEEIKSSLFFFDAISFLRKNETSSSCSELKYDIPKRKKQSSCDDLIAIATKHLKQRQNQSQFEKLVESWSLQLEQMDTQQGIFAEKFINDILFEGKMGTLERSTISFRRASTSIPLSRDALHSYASDNSIANGTSLEMDSKVIPGSPCNFGNTCDYPLATPEIRNEDQRMEIFEDNFKNDLLQSKNKDQCNSCIENQFQEESSSSKRFKTELKYIQARNDEESNTTSNSAVHLFMKSLAIQIENANLSASAFLNLQSNILKLLADEINPLQ